MYSLMASWSTRDPPPPLFKSEKLQKAELFLNVMSCCKMWNSAKCPLSVSGEDYTLKIQSGQRVEHLKWFICSNSILVIFWGCVSTDLCWSIGLFGSVLLIPGRSIHLWLLWWTVPQGGSGSQSVFTHKLSVQWTVFPEILIEGAVWNTDIFRWLYGHWNKQGFFFLLWMWWIKKGVVTTATYMTSGA